MAYVTEFKNNLLGVDVDALENDVAYLEEFRIINSTDFKEFLAEWREIHKEVVDTIQFYKRNKNNMCLVQESDLGVLSWNNAVTVGKFAHRMYRLRDQLKASHELEKANTALANAVVYEVRT